MKNLIPVLVLLALTSANFAQADGLADRLLNSIPSSPRSALPLPGDSDRDRADDVARRLRDSIPAGPRAPLPLPAQSGVVDCYGYQYGMRDHVVVTRDIDDKNELACNIQNTSQAWIQIEQYCNDDDVCSFRGHVIRQEGNFYVIDRIVGGIAEDDLSARR